MSIPLLCKLLGCIFLLIDDLIRLGRIAWKKVAVSKNDVDKKGEKISRTQFLSRTALAVAAVPFATLMYGMMGTAFDFKVRRIKLHLPKLPAGFEGLKIVQISDIHCGSFVSDEPFIKALKMIDEDKRSCDGEANPSHAKDDERDDEVKDGDAVKVFHG